jgi:hypothetical protein
MTSTLRVISVFMIMPALSLAAERAGLLSIEQAQELSQATGRPILAMAGSKT